MTGINRDTNFWVYDLFNRKGEKQMPQIRFFFLYNPLHTSY